MWVRKMFGVSEVKYFEYGQLGLDAHDRIGNRLQKYLRVKKVGARYGNFCKR